MLAKFTCRSVPVGWAELAKPNTPTPVGLRKLSPTYKTGERSGARLPPPGGALLQGG